MLSMLFVAFFSAIAHAVVVVGFGGVEAELGWAGLGWVFCHANGWWGNGDYFGAAAATFLSTKMRICEFSLFLCF